MSNQQSDQQEWIDKSMDSIDMYQKFNSNQAVQYTQLADLHKQNSSQNVFRQLTFEDDDLHNKSVNRSVISQPEDNYKEIFSNFDNIQNKIQQLNDMANFIIKKEEEDDEAVFTINTNGVIDAKELKQIYEQKNNTSVREDRANSNWVHENYLNDLNKTKSSEITNELVNNIISEIQQYSGNKNEQNQHEGLLNLDQQAVKIKQLQSENAQLNKQIKKIVVNLQRQKVDVAKLEDSSIVYVKSSHMELKNKQLQKSAPNNNQILPSLDRQLSAIKSDHSSQELEELQNKVCDSNQTIQTLEYKLEMAEKKLKQKDESIADYEEQVSKLKQELQDQQMLTITENKDVQIKKFMDFVRLKCEQNQEYEQYIQQLTNKVDCLYNNYKK